MPLLSCMWDTAFILEWSMTLFSRWHRWEAMLACVHVVCILHMSKPGSARHAPGRKFQKLDMTIKNNLLSSCSWPRTQSFFCRGNTLLVKARLRVWPLYWWKGGRGWASKKWPNTRHEIWYMYWFIHVHIELDPRARSFMKFTAAAQLRSLSSRIVSLSEKNRIEIQNIS